MEKNLFALIIILLMLLMIAFICPSYSTASEENGKISVQKINQQIDSIQKYEVNLKTRIYPPDASDFDSNAPIDFDPNQFMEVNTKVFGESGKRMNIQTTLKSPEFGSEIDFSLIFDGTWLWVEQEVKKHSKMKIEKPLISAIKIHIPDVSPDPEKEPFNTIYGVSGTGLFRYKDFPGTLKEIIKTYNFTDIVNSENSGEIIITGFKRDLGSNQKNSKRKDLEKELKDFLDEHTRFCKLWVSEDSWMIKSYSFGKSDKRPSMYTEIEYISVNEMLPDNIFVYNPPEGVVVRDATSSILQKMKQHNN